MESAVTKHLALDIDVGVTTDTSGIYEWLLVTTPKDVRTMSHEDRKLGSELRPVP